jgi:hypothetical protein
MVRIDDLTKEVGVSSNRDGGAPGSQSQLPSKSPHPMNSESQKPVDMTPSLPPQLESIRTQKAEDIVKRMARAPLFMTSLEEAEADGM